MAVTRPGTVRLTVAGPEPLIVDLEMGEPAVSGPPIAVRELAASPAERAAGLRRFESVVDGWVFTVTAEDAGRAKLRERAARVSDGAGPKVRAVLRAQIPGRVVRVWVAAGDHVEVGHRLLAIEAMKMENEIRAAHAGTVTSVSVVLGQAVELGDELAAID